MSQFFVKQAKQNDFKFEIQQIDVYANCNSDEKEQGRLLTMKLTEALNSLPVNYKQALASGDFYSEDGVAALRALRQVSRKKDVD